MLILLKNNLIKTKICKLILNVNHPICYMHSPTDKVYLEEYYLSQHPEKKDEVLRSFYYINLTDCLDPQLKENIKALEYVVSPVPTDLIVPIDFEYTFGEIIIPENEILTNFHMMVFKDDNYLSNIVADFELKYHYNISYSHFVHMLNIMSLDFKWNNVYSDFLLFDNIIRGKDDMSLYLKDRYEMLTLAEDDFTENVFSNIMEHPEQYASESMLNEIANTKHMVESLEEPLTNNKLLDIQSPLEVPNISVLPSPQAAISSPQAEMSNIPSLNETSDTSFMSPMNNVLLSSIAVGITCVVLLAVKQSNHLYSPYEYDFIINLNLFAQVMKIICILQIPLWLLIMYKLRYYYFYCFKIVLKTLWN